VRSKPPERHVMIVVDCKVGDVNSEIENPVWLRRSKTDRASAVDILVSGRLPLQHARHRHHFHSEVRNPLMGAGVELFAVRRGRTDSP